jgi:hypothetical protein
VPHGILQVFIIILNENVFQNPEVFPTQVSLSPKQSTLVLAKSFEKMPFSGIIFGDYYVAFRGLLCCSSGIITVPG